MRTSKPLPISRSASSTFGLSRRSSVSHLEAQPEHGDRAGRVAMTRSTTSRTTSSLLRSVPARSGTSTSLTRAMYSSARRSFGQAGPAEGEARPQVGRGDVQLGVLAEDLHDLARVDAVGAEHPGDLVRERDLRGVEGVAGVLQRLCGRDGDWCGSRSRKENSRASTRCARSSAVPDDDERRGEEVGHARALAEELRGTSPCRPPSRRAPARRTSAATRSSTVPGGTVLRTTTAWKPDSGGRGHVHRRADVRRRPAM